MIEVKFFVPGKPTQTGSKVPFIQKPPAGTNKCPECGNWLYKLVARLFESNSRYKVWRKAVMLMAKAEMNRRGLVPFDGPVRLEITFYFPRPKYHFGTGKNAAALKDNAPCYAIKEPDLDKLVRNTQDGLSKIVFDDDKLVCELEVGKNYETDSAWHGAEIRVTPL